MPTKTGFSLVEVIIALGILSIGIYALTEAQRSTYETIFDLESRLDKVNIERYFKHNVFSGKLQI